MIFLERAYPPDQRAVLGELKIGDWQCHTLELPWRMNEANRSCIPEGTYKLQLRKSPLITRITKGEFDEGWEIMHVPDRTYILFHPGNWIEDSRGCVLVGRKAEWSDREGHRVTHSQLTFGSMMAEMAKLPPEALRIHIGVRRVGW